MKLMQRITSAGHIQVTYPKLSTIFWIGEVEPGIFSVTSNDGIDSYTNGLHIDDIRFAFKFIEQSIRTRIEDRRAEQASIDPVERDIAIARAFFYAYPFATKVHVALKTKLDISFISTHWDAIISSRS